MKYDLNKILKDFLKDNKKSVFGYLFLTLAIPLSKVLLPYYYGKIIDQVACSKKNFKFTPELINNFKIVFFVWILTQILWSSMNFIDSYFIPEIQGYIRKNIIEKVLDTFKERFHEQEIGILLTHIIKLPMFVKAILDQLRWYILPAIVIFIASIGYFFYINVGLGIISLTTIVAFFGSLKLFSNTCSEPATEMNDRYNNLHENISDVLSNLINVYTAGTTDEEIDKLLLEQEGYKKKYTETLNCTTNFRFIFNFIYIFLFFVINGYSFYLYSKKKIHLDHIVTILIISLYLITEMSHVISEADEFNYNLNSIEQIQGYLNRLEEIENDSSARMNPVNDSSTRMNPIKDNYPLNNLSGDIIFEDINIKYGDKEIVENLNLIIKDKEKVCLTGKIGTGKTSIINALIRLIQYDGNIYIGDINTKDLDLSELRRKITYVPQNPRLFNRTIFQNIIYGTTTQGEYKKLREYIEDLFNRYQIEFNLDDEVGKNGSKLSGGQRQIIYLIRCLLKDSNILLLDEPTASLDYQTKMKIFTILKDLMKDKTVIIVSHDSEILPFVDRKIILGDKGVILSE
jgi:ABC-type multidrug transport system fused ATPase/permease subunit